MVIKINQHEINQDLDSYISDRVDPKDRKRTIKKDYVSDSSFEQEDFEFYEPKEPFYRKIFNLFGRKKTEIIREIDEFEEEVEKDIEEATDDMDEFEEEETIAANKPGFFQKLIRLFRFSYDEYDAPSDEEEAIYDELDQKNFELPDDVKEIIKIQHKWIQKLAPDKKKEFKESMDFEKYKDMLSKYNLIK
ncbi:MAG: hypothetical protein KKF44_06300 [Nanoarchaeota archaeon]|nr:hypothetical protein [Nanoarchaeota archaeon]